MLRFASPDDKPWQLLCLRRLTLGKTLDSIIQVLIGLYCSAISILWEVAGGGGKKYRPAATMLRVNSPKKDARSELEPPSASGKPYKRYLTLQA